jgi:hypothetical protein
VSKRAGRKKDGGGSKQVAGAGQKSQFATKAVFETTKKKEVGVSDLTLISKVSNEAINENLKKRFENAEIYVSRHPTSAAMPHKCVHERAQETRLTLFTDIHWTCAGVRQSFPRSYVAVPMRLFTS